MLNLERKNVLVTHPQQELVEGLAKIPLGFIHHVKSIISDSVTQFQILDKVCTRMKNIIKTIRCVARPSGSISNIPAARLSLQDLQLMF